MKWLAVLQLCVVLASGSWAAEPVDRLRVAARSVQGELDELRGQQAARQTELRQLSLRIEALKAEAKGPLGRRLMASPELEGALRRSQELADTLTAGAQQLVAREADLERARQALVDRLGRELEVLGAAFDSASDRASRRAYVERMRPLRAERDALRAALPAPRLPSLHAPARTDDPYELLAQADLYRDGEDKLQRELERIERRIRERREERELDQRVQRFLGEESMFDDSDRRLRVERAASLPPPSAASSSSPQGPGATSGDGPASPPALSGGAGASPSAQPAPPRAGPLGANPFAEPAPAAGGAAPSTGGTAPTPASAPPLPTSRTSPTEPAGPTAGADSSFKGVTQRATDARPSLGSPRAGGDLDDADLEALEGERARVHSLAASLRRQAAELEARARALR